MLVALSCEAKTIKIAIIDTGIDLNNKEFKLCINESKDFTESKEGIQDAHGHGTHVASLIQEYAGNGDYCLVILKYYLEKATGAENLKRSNEAFIYAFKLKVDYINYSGGGPEPSDLERKLIKNNPKTTIIAAMGNDRSNLDLYCDYYPTCYNYKNVIRVGNIDIRGRRAPSSNRYSKADYWAWGWNVKAKSIGNRLVYMTGTSQATAKVTGLLVKRRLNTRQSYNGLTYKADGLFIQVLDIIDCAKWHNRCININK